jgi:hypothetical protein
LYKTLCDGKPLDIVTVNDASGAHKPQLLSQEMLPGETLFTKTRREGKFPLALLAYGLNARLEDGEASVLADKNRILACIAKDGMPGHAEAEVMAGLQYALERANTNLHSYLALAAWPQAMKNGCVADFDPMRPGLVQLPWIVSRNKYLEKVQLSLSHMEEMSDAQMKLIGECLPPRVKKVHLRFDGCLNITDDGVASLAQSLPRTVQSLHLDFLGCKSVTDRGLQSLALKLPQLALRELRLDFAMCEKLGHPGVQALRDNLPAKLERFAATFQGSQVNQRFKSTQELHAYFAGQRFSHAMMYLKRKTLPRQLS